eukprot:9128926-Alexandrium_andersonii.AAC.1
MGSPSASPLALHSGRLRVRRCRAASLPAVRAGKSLLCWATTSLVASSTASWTDQSLCKSSAYRTALPAMCSQ